MARLPSGGTSANTLGGGRYLEIASERSAAAQRVADSRHDGVPLTLLGRRIIDQDAMHVVAGEIAAVVPDLVPPDAGDHEEARRNALVDDIRGRFLSGKEGSRRDAVIWNCLHRQVCAAIARAKLRAKAVRPARLLAEYRGGDLNRGPRLGDPVTAPARGLGSSGRRTEHENKRSSFPHRPSHPVRGACCNSMSASLFSVATSRSPAHAVRKMASASRSTWAACTGSARVSTAASSAALMISITSGVNAALEKFFMAHGPGERRSHTSGPDNVGKKWKFPSGGWFVARSAGGGCGGVYSAADVLLFQRGHRAA